MTATHVVDACQRARTALAAAVVLFAFLQADALAHGGGLNAEGCHNDRKNGGYHCHRAPSISAVPQEVTATPRPTPQMVSAPTRPTCYTGPKGGTYTITASGKKNYSGC